MRFMPTTVHHGSQADEIAFSSHPTWVTAASMRHVVFALLWVTACGGKDSAQTAKVAPAAASKLQQPAALDKPAPTEASSNAVAQDVVIDHEVATLDGKRVSLSAYRGKAVLVVNTASECGYTPQYAGLQKLYAELAPRGFEVLAFPSDDFGNQEPGTSEQIAAFVDEKFDVQFPMFDKVHAKGPEIAPLYKTLTEQTGEGIAGPVKWNFTKFLIDAQGHVVGRFEPPVDPADAKLRAAIEAILPK